MYEPKYEHLYNHFLVILIDTCLLDLIDHKCDNIWKQVIKIIIYIHILCRSNPLGLCIATCLHKLSIRCTHMHLMRKMGIKYWLVLTRQLTIIPWIIFLLFHSNYPSSHDVYCKFKYLVNNPITLVYKYSVVQLILKIKRLGMHLICIIIP